MADDLLGAVEDWFDLARKRNVNALTWFNPGLGLFASLPQQIPSRFISTGLLPKSYRSPNDYTHIDQGFLPVTLPPHPQINYDWPNPKGKQYPSDLRTFINPGLPYPVAFARGLVVQRLYQLKLSPLWEQPPNIVLHVPRVNVPFHQFDWPVPTKKNYYEHLTVNVRPQITGIPFSQTDWPLPRGAKSNYPLNVSIRYQISSNPFYQLDWPLTRALQRKVQDWSQSINIATLIANVTPFAQSDWPNPTGAKSNQPLGQIVLLQTQNNVAGFNVYDWPNPRGPQFPSGLRTVINNNVPQYPKVDPNIGPFDWPNPRGYPYPIELRTLFNRLSLPKPVPPPPVKPGDYFFKFRTQTDAFLDPVVGPLLALPGKLIPIWIYDTSTESAEVVDGWWCLLVVAAPVPTSISKHPNLEFALDRQAAFTPGYANGQDTIIIINNIGPELGYLQIVSPMGPMAYANAGIH